MYKILDDLSSFVLPWVHAFSFKDPKSGLLTHFCVYESIVHTLEDEIMLWWEEDIWFTEEELQVFWEWILEGLAILQ